MITKPGNKLAWKLAPMLGYTRNIAEICSLLHRHAVTYHHIQECNCNGHPALDNPNIPIERANQLQEKYQEWLDKREQQLEKRMNHLALNLPHTDSGPLIIRFSGDPRGACVTLMLPDDIRAYADNWTRDGIIV